MNVWSDRVNAVENLNIDLASEGLPLIEATGKSFISPLGYIWHEVKDTNNYLTYVTTSVPAYMKKHGEKVFGAADLKEAFGFDEDF